MEGLIFGILRYVQLCVAMGGCVDVWGSVCSYGWLCVVICGEVSRSVAMCSHVQPCVAMGAGYVDTCDCVQLWVAMCSYVLLYVAMCDKVWLSAGQGAPGVGTGVAMCSHV